MTTPAFRRAIVILAALIPASGALAQATRPDTTADPFRWLEDVNGERSMTWVRAENARTLGVLEKDPRFQALYRDALTIAEARDRVPFPSFLNGQLYNFWQDGAHVRGIWRRTTIASYRTASPKWTIVLDLDSLARTEGANWVWHGAECAQPAERRCMLSLSDGGEDAVTVREFDLGTRSFVQDGFMIPHGKQRLTWMGEDTLLVSREWTKGELTASGYPFIVKRVVRGQPLASAAEIYRGSAADGGYGVSPSTLVDGSGHRITTIVRPLSTFEFEHYVVRPNGVMKLRLPLKSSVVDLVDNQLVVELAELWNTGTALFTAGSLASFDVAEAMADPQHLAVVPIFEPGPRESIGAVRATRHHLVASLYQNVKGRIVFFTRSAKGTWSRRTAALPDNLATGLVSANPLGDDAFVSVTGFLTPSSLWLANARSGGIALVKTSPSKFDASREVVEQLEATSKDGTKVPYFVVHPRGMKRDGLNPTIIYAYGGFLSSSLPSYNATLGKLWLEKSGVWVLANIRGGGEFGPAWHEAGLKTKRQVIYDDFAAVAQDLIARKITSPRRLGIEGGSNGGLLMGVELTQHPELWSAVDIQVPLLDMLRYEQIAAGTSWVGEYGSVSIPAERAFLASISPYENLKAGVKYPTPLIWTTTKDDRVGPQHARKFAARMSSMGLPYLFYEVVEGGHGAGANLKERAHTSALEFTYFAQRLMGLVP